MLIDTSPDLREQALAAGIGSLDGVLYTHSHADHIHGIDDLRGFVMNMQRRVDIYADEPTLARLRSSFGYCFETPPGSEYPPHRQRTPDRGGRAGDDRRDRGAPSPPCRSTQIHGRITSLAFRFGGLAYSPDASGFEAEAEDCSPVSTSGSSTRSGRVRIRAIFRSTRRSSGSDGSSRSARS